MLHVYQFGFCTPRQKKDNDEHGWDDESSEIVVIDALSPEEALTWGREVSEEFCKLLYLRGGWTSNIPSWKEGNFAHGLTTEIDALEYARSLASIKVGEMPDFEYWWHRGY